VGGDLNTEDLSEPCLTVFGTFLDYNNHAPADQNGDTDTSKNRDNRYDWLMPNSLLDAKHATLSRTGWDHSYPQGLVFDSLIFTPLSAVPPI